MGGQLLCAEHSGSPIGMLKAQVLDSFEKENPGDQYGGVAGGSTDVPTHVLQAFAQRAAASGRSYSIIFLPSTWCRGNSSWVRA